MKKIIYIIVSIMLISCMLVGCGNDDLNVQNTLDKVEPSGQVQIENKDPIQTLPVETPNINESKPVKISAEEAKAIMDSNEDFIILDVRTLEEYNEGHIKNAVLLPVDNIEKEAGPVIGGKDKTILVYCRSGNRSSMASSKLASLGYTDIRDFGGITAWPYEIVIE